MSNTPEKIEQLEALARGMVGDGGEPNLFFVTIEGVVVLISRNGEVAYHYWLTLVGQNPKGAHCLEDRQTGVICQRDIDDETGKAFLIDDFERFSK